MSNALSLLYETLTKKEEEARNIYLAARQSQINFERQLEALNQYRSTYSSELVDRGMGGRTISPFTYCQYSAFIGRLDTISKEQMAGLERIKKEVEKKLQQYKEIEAKRKGIEMLMDKREKQKLAIQAKQEQKMSDDLSTNRYFQNQQNQS